MSIKIESSLFRFSFQSGSLEVDFSGQADLRKHNGRQLNYSTMHTYGPDKTRNLLDFRLARGSAPRPLLTIRRFESRKLHRAVAEFSLFRRYLAKSAKTPKLSAKSIARGSSFLASGVWSGSFQTLCLPPIHPT
jgi:hypothetical protein